MTYVKGNINCNKKDNSFLTVKNFDRNKIIVFTEKTREYINSSPEVSEKYKELVHWLTLAKKPFEDKNNCPEIPFLYYHRFKPVITFLKENLLCKECLDRAGVLLLMDIREEMYKKHCVESKFWIDVRDKEAFSKLPHVIGVEIEDKFLVLDGHHRCTLYCIDDSLSLNFDCLENWDIKY